MLLQNAPVNEKPECVKTHLRNAIILPEMIGCVIGIHNGKVYNQVEIKVRSIVCCTFFFRKQSTLAVSC